MNANFFAQTPISILIVNKVISIGQSKVQVPVSAGRSQIYDECDYPFYH